MEKRGNVEKVQKGTYEFLYKGFVACSECSKEMYVAYSTGGSGKKHLYYCCRGENHRPTNIKAKKIQIAFDKILQEIRIHEDVIGTIDRFVGRRLKEQAKEAGKAVKECERAVERIEKERVKSYKDMKKEMKKRLITMIY